jgi:creatinine amidohydrolase/Fe(II)-dependent formamide hydrolase-like protein
MAVVGKGRRAALGQLLGAAGGLAALPAMAATQADVGPASMWLEDLTWPELRERIQAGSTTLIVPIGGVEQSGPFIALGKHNQRVRVIAQKIAEALGNALLAPVVAYVPEGNTAPPTSHMRFPGTITVPEEVFVQTLMSAAESLRVHGMRHVVFLGDHGGYRKSVERAAAQLNRRWAGSAQALVPPEYYRASSDGFNAILRQQGFRDDEIGTHAGLADAALQLAVAPDAVRSLRNAPKPGAADGVYGGDPRRATAALGQRGIELIVHDTVAALRRDISR